MLKFLIDECLSPQLAGVARARGHQAQHLNWLGAAGKSDRAIAALALADDWIVVTNNGMDFRPIYRAMDIHPGLVVILPSAGRSDQMRLFQLVLDYVATVGEPVNLLIEIDIDGQIAATDLPPVHRND